MVNGSWDLNWTERKESLKAGGLAAVSGGLAFGLLSLSHPWIWAQLGLEPMHLMGFPGNGLEFISAAIALLSSFLFGVTYRYIVRTDENLHLRSGAVLAFGLVRGLAQLDVGLHIQATTWVWGILTGESILLFAIARLILDWSLAQGWVKPFPSN